MVVEIVPRPKAKPKRITNVLFYFSLVLLILTIAAYFGLYSISDKKNQELEDLRTRLAVQETAELKDLKKSLIEYEEKIGDLSILLDSYREPTKFFEFLGTITHPRVMWLNVTLNLIEGKASISGRADSITTLIQQTYIFEEESRIEDFNLSSFLLEEEGEVSFSVDFSLASQLYK